MVVGLGSIYERVDFYVYDLRVIPDYDREIVERIILGEKRDEIITIGGRILLSLTLGECAFLYHTFLTINKVICSFMGLTNCLHHINFCVFIS